MAQADQQGLYIDRHQGLPHPQTTEVLRELERITANPIFAKSPQAARLLSFLVRETLSGDAGDTRNNLKEYSIAVHVFGRAVNFDPSSDNIVRVEVRRVRSKLTRYYADEGAIDPVIITIPKGSYVPVFENRETSDSDLSGRPISHYTLVNRRCANQWQTTYDANCLHLQRSVIVILPTRSALEDEHKRHSLLTRTRVPVIDHPNVAAVYDVEATSEGRVIIACAAMPGRPLREYAERERLAGDQALAFAREFASALASAHSAEMLHGNLNPESVYVDTGTGLELPHPVLMPFGLVPLVDIDIPAFEGFRAPEWTPQFDPDMRSDVWSYGALIWLACYGAPPRVGALDTTENRLTDVMPPQLAKVVDRCLQSNPKLRYANAGEILHALMPPVEVRSSVGPPHRQAGPRKTVLLTASLLALLIVAIGAGLNLRNKIPSTSTPRISANHRVIVLPFTNIGGEPENDPYCRGVAELLASRLALLPGLDLISSRSLGPGKTDQLSMEYLQQKLRIDYVVDGTLFKRDDQFQATAKLTRVSDGKYSWTKAYSGNWAEVFKVFDDMSDGAVEAMGLIVQSDRRSPLSPAQVSSEARDGLMKARFSVYQFLNSYSSSDFERAERLLSQTLELDPNYVDAMIEFAQLYRGAAFPPQGNQTDVLQKASRFADAAIALEPQNGQAQAVRGAVYLDLGQPRLSLKYLQSALKANPRDPFVHAKLSVAYDEMGFWESGLVEIDKTIEINPFTRGASEGRADILARLGRFPEAIQALDTAEQKGRSWRTMMASVLFRAGNLDRAKDVLKRTQAWEPPGVEKVANALLALIEAAEGNPRQVAQALAGLPLNEHRRSDYAALLVAIAGKNALLFDQITRWTNVASYRWLINQPLLRPYRSDPEFRELVRHLHRDWEQNLVQFGAAVPVKPPRLPSPEQYL